MAVLAALLVLASPLIVVSFPATGEVHALAAAMLPVWAPFIIFDGLPIVLVYTLRSLGAQVVAGINSIIAYFRVTGGLGWALVHEGAGPLGVVMRTGAGVMGADLLH